MKTLLLVIITLLALPTAFKVLGCGLRADSARAVVACYQKQF